MAIIVVVVLVHVSFSASNLGSDSRSSKNFKIGAKLTEIQYYKKAVTYFEPLV